MDEIRLDGRGWKTKEDFYNAFLAAVEAPDWHGRNLDALWDSIVEGGINRRELPYRVVVGGLQLHECRSGGDYRAYFCRSPAAN